MACIVSFIPATAPEWVLELEFALNAVAIGLVSLAALKLSISILKNKLDIYLCWVSAWMGILVHDRQWIPPLMIFVGGLTQSLLFIYKQRDLLGSKYLPQVHCDPLIHPTSSSDVDFDEVDVTIPVSPNVLVQKSDSDRLVMSPLETPISSQSYLLPSSNPSVIDRKWWEISGLRLGLLSVGSWLFLLIIMLVLRNVLPLTPAGQAVNLFATIYTTGSVDFILTVLAVLATGIDALYTLIKY